VSLEHVARRAVEAAVEAGATDAEAWTEEGVSRRVRVYAGEVESLSDAGGRGVGVRAFVDGRSGYAFGCAFSRLSLHAELRLQIGPARLRPPAAPRIHAAARA
jgi:predicted Zn-dependent protease